MPPLLRFARYREIAVEIASRLASNGDEEIIVSSGGLAAAATAELLRETKSGVVSVRLAMLDEFARRVVNEAGEYPRAATDMERRLAMRAAIAAIDEPMMETRGIVSMLERSYRDVRDGGMTLDAFEKAIKRGISLRDRKRTEMLIRAWRAYERRIADLQAVDAADILERAAALIESERVPVAAQVIAGFYDMTGAQLRLLHALEKSGKVTAILVPIGDDSAYAFASRFVSHVGRASARQEPALHIKASEVTVAQFENKESELRTICNSIRELLDAGTPANQIGITARALDPDDVRLLSRFAGELGFQVSASLQFPLLGHRLGRGTATILRLRERNFPRSEVIDVLRDGFVPQHRVEIDAIDKATRRARISGGRSTEIRNAANDPRIEDYRAVVAELELLKTLAEIAERFRLDTDLDLAAAAAVDDIVSLLSRWKQPVSAETMIELLEQQSLRQRPAANGQPVIWAGDVMKFRGRSFAHLFVIRAQDGVFPQRRVDDPLVPDSDRRQLGIREIGDGRDEERLLFQLLRDGAGSIQFSFASSDTFGKILRPSRLLKNVGPALSRSAPAGEPAPRENLQRQLQLVVLAGTRSVFDGYLGADEKIREWITTISPTQLEDFGECPQKFLLKHVLRVEDYDDPDRELQMHHREKGKLDHTILERFFKATDTSELARARWFLPQLAPELRERADAIVDTVFDEEEQRVPAFNRVMRQIERRMTKHNLHAFLSDDIADFAENGLQPKHFEYKFGPKYAKRGAVDHPDPFVVTARGVAIRVEGSIDRIDEGENKLRIVDYKSGKALRHTLLAEKIDRGVRLQLALYAMAVAEFFKVDANSISGEIKPLIVRDTDPRKLRFELGKAESRLRETFELFVSSILRGAFPAFPNDDDKDKNFNACKYCPVNLSCRTRHSDAERRVVLREKDPRTLLEQLT